MIVFSTFFTFRPGLGQASPVLGRRVKKRVGRTKWFFINPPIVNMNTNPNANSIDGVNLIDPP